MLAWNGCIGISGGRGWKRVSFEVAVVVLEEVIVQDVGDAHQKVGVYALAFEDGIHIGTVAIELLCEPDDGAFLAVQFRFYKLSDVYHGVGIKKKAEPFITYSVLRYRQAPRI